MSLAPRPPLPALTATLAVALAVAVVGCDTSSCESSGLNCPPGPGQEDVVAGVSLSALFAPPRGAEVEAALAGWRAGVPPSRQAVLRDVAVVDLGERETVRVVEGVSETGVRFVGALRLPAREAGDARTRPVLLVLGPDADADVGATVRRLPVRDDLAGEFATLHLAYRGGTLRVGGQSFSSPGPPSTYNGDAEDAYALVAGLASLGGLAGVDRRRVAVAGEGRGGAVALLYAARAKARGRAVPAYVLSLAAPASLFTPSVETAARQFLTDRPVGDFPGIADALAATAGRVRDGEATVEQARLELLRRSAAPFFAPPRGAAPPFVFAVFGLTGSRITREDARALDFLTGQPENGLYLEIEDGTDASIGRDGQVLSTGASFLCALVLSDTVAGCR